MRSIPSIAAAVLMMFGTMQLAAHEPERVPTTAPAPQAPAVAPNTAGSISGNAVTASNGQASGKSVQLRDAQSGRIVASSLTDKTGTFSFASVDPGNYIVEVLGANQAVVAASSVLTLHAGEALAVAIKLPLLVTGGILGGTAAMATIIAAGAAAAGVLAVKTVGDPTCPQ